MDEEHKKHFRMSLAGHIIALNIKYSSTYYFCREYLSNCEPEIEISITDSDLKFEKEKASEAGHSHDERYLELMAVNRKIAEEMPAFDTLLMHGAVVAVGSDAYMFTANSGTGKTTHVRKWIDKDKSSFILNGDKPLIKITDSQVEACGTPWCGKERLGTNVMVPLKAIILMERSEDNRIERVAFDCIFPGLLAQTYHPKSSEKVRKTMSLLLQLNGKVDFYKYWFNNFKDDAFEVAHSALIQK